MELPLQWYMARYLNEIVNGTFDPPKKCYIFVLEVSEGHVGFGHDTKRSDFAFGVSNFRQHLKRN